MTDERTSARQDMRTQVSQILSCARQALGQADELDLDEETESLLDAVQAAAHQSLALLDAPHQQGGPAKQQELAALVTSMIEQATRVSELADSVGNRAVVDAGSLIARAAYELRSLMDRPLDAILPTQPGPRLRASHPAAASAGTLLLVAGDVSQGDGLATTLTGLGYAVLRADDSQSALAMLANAHVDLVLLDHETAAQDGHAFLKRRRTDARQGAIPVIVVTHADEDDRIVRSIRLGADDYLPRSSDPVLVRARVNAYVQLKRLREQVQARQTNADD